MAEGKSERIRVVEARAVRDESGEVVAFEIDPEELAQAAVDFATVVRTVGGVCSFAADRAEVEPGVFVTERVVFRWLSYVPARRQKPQEPAQQAPMVEEAPEVVVEEPVAS